jgi:asparagine synthase (glutamine-hydrolysing)
MITGVVDEHIDTLLATNADFARQMLLDGELMRRGMLDRAATESALSHRVNPGASEVGEIHFFLAIEAWLQRWTSRRARTA